MIQFKTIAGKIRELILFPRLLAERECYSVTGVPIRLLFGRSPLHHGDITLPEKIWSYFDFVIYSLTIQIKKILKIRIIHNIYAIKD